MGTKVGRSNGRVSVSMMKTSDLLRKVDNAGRDKPKMQHELQKRVANGVKLENFAEND